MTDAQDLAAPAGSYSDEQPTDSRTRNRLRLTGSRARAEHIDGAWWPGSKRLADELPELLAAVHDRLGPVVMVGYRRDGWTTTPPQVQVGGGRTVELLGFTSDEPPTVILIGEDGHHLTLQVVNPDTNERQAEQALEGSSTARSVADVARKLALHDGRNDAERDAEILRWCEGAASQFDDARIQSFVPILVEHIVNNRMFSNPLREAIAIRHRFGWAASRRLNGPARSEDSHDLLAERRDAIPGLSKRDGIGHNVGAGRWR